VNRIRELPQNRNIVATHTDSSDVLIWDVEAQPNRHAVLGAADSCPDLVGTLNVTGEIKRTNFLLVVQCCMQPPKDICHNGTSFRIILVHRSGRWLINLGSLLQRPHVSVFSMEDYLTKKIKSKNDVLIGHQDNAEFALAMCPVEPFVLSGGKDKTVVLWSIHDHISTVAADVVAGSSKSGGSGKKNPSKGGNNKLIDSSSIGPRGIYQGHDDTVEDVQFCPTSPQEFCSVGDDSCLILWDARVGCAPVIKVGKAHDADLHCVDWNHHDSNLILTGSADNSVHMFDRRNLSAAGGGSPVHKFEGHSAAVLCVQWSPEKRSVFGSSAEDGTLNIWDHEKVSDIVVTVPLYCFSRRERLSYVVYLWNLILQMVGKRQDRDARMSDSPPGLFFRHAGHRDKVVDFHWNASDPWTIVSVSDDGESTGGGGTLQIWRMIDLLYRDQDEVLSELEKLKPHILSCSS
ncbi:WD40 repeat, partial [Dillenia turbinata]